MCLLIPGAPSLLPGWGCCSCRAYNGLQRRICKACATPHPNFKGARCGEIDELVKQAEEAGEIRTCGGCGAGYRPEHLAGGERSFLVLGESGLLAIRDQMPGPVELRPPVKVGKCVACGSWSEELVAKEIVGQAGQAGKES